MSSRFNPEFTKELEAALDSDATVHLDNLIQKHGTKFLKRMFAFNEDERTNPLTYAVLNSKSPEIVEFLIKADQTLIHLREDPPFGSTPLHWAVRSDNRYEKADMLLKYGAEACKNNSDNIQKMNYRALVNIKDNQGNTPLHHACNYRAYKMVSLLLSYGADTAIKNNDGETAIEIIKRHQDPFLSAKHAIEIGDLRKRIEDVCRTVTTLKEQNDIKDDRITSFERQSLEQTDHYERFLTKSENLIKAFEEATVRNNRLEEELVQDKEQFNKYEAKIQSQNKTINCLSKELEAVKALHNRHEDAIQDNTTNIRMNELKIESRNQSTQSLAEDLCLQNAESMAAKIESLRNETQELRCNASMVLEIKYELEKVVDCLAKTQDPSEMIQCSESKVQVSCPTALPIPVVVEQFNSLENKTVQSKCKRECSKDKTTCSEDTTDYAKVQVECSVCERIYPTDKTELSNGSSETALKPVFDSDITIPKRFANDDVPRISDQIIRISGVEGASPSSSSLRSSCSHASTSDQIIRIRAVERANPSLSSLQSCYPVTFTSDSSVEEESETR